MPPPILYIWCSVTYRTSFPQSPQALPITYLQYALSSVSPLMAVWAQACDLKAEAEYTRVFFFFFSFQLSSSSLALYRTTTVSHIPTGRLSLWKEHSALRVPAASPWWAAIPSSAQIINFTHVWTEKKKSCGAFKQLFTQTCCFRQTKYRCRKVPTSTVYGLLMHHTFFIQHMVWRTRCFLT